MNLPNGERVRVRLKGQAYNRSARQNLLNKAGRTLDGRMYGRKRMLGSGKLCRGHQIQRGGQGGGQGEDQGEDQGQVKVNKMASRKWKRENGRP